MTDKTELVISNQGTPGGFSMELLKSVQGLSEDSPLLKLQSGSSQPRLTVNGNKFYIRKSGSEMMLKEVAEVKGKKRKVPSQEILTVIHSFHPVIQRQASKPYNANLGYQPIGCWSNSGREPDEDVWNKQADLCDECPIKMSEQGKDGCSLNRQIAVSLYQGPKGEVQDLMLMTTNWSSNSKKKAGEDPEELIFGLANYLEFLKSNKIESHRVITRMIIDTESDNKPANNCKVLFQPAGVIKDNEASALAHRRWIEEDDIDMAEIVRIKQYKPASEDDSTVGGDYGAEEAEEAAAPVTKKVASKKRATKKVAAKASKPKPAPEPEEEEEMSLDDLDELDSEEEVEEDLEEELDEELEDEDPNDLGIDFDEDLDDLEDI